MKSIYHYSLCLFLLAISHTTFGMLSLIEKMILTHEVEACGTKFIREAIKNTPDNHPIGNNSYRTYTALTRHKIFYHTKEKDELTNLVIETIVAKEKKDGYRPQHETKETHNTVKVTLPNNTLGLYTRYWHDHDRGERYIFTTSEFDKASLKEFLAQHKSEE